MNRTTIPAAGIRRAFAALTIALMASIAPSALFAAESNWPMESFSPNLENMPSLQNGWRVYMNYCIGCHSLKHQRYERTADDLEIPHDIVLDELIFTGQKIGELMTIAMDPAQAKAWFGAPPPDLTMVTRVRGTEWVYNYLKTFYLDEARPFGVNNKVFENVGMPNVLQGLQGIQTSECIQMPKVADNGGEMRDPLVPGKAITEERCGQLVLEEGSGSMTAEEFDQTVYDLTNFLHYVSEPSRLERQRIGVYVILFLIILYVLTFLLAREFQKDVKH
jgi:ubiquinol-cytochrome c reductase cytochrome c1 subunit